MADLKTLLKPLVPPSVLSAWYKFNANRERAELERCRSPKETFTTIYRRGHWGKSGDPADRIFSGSGSRDPKIVGVYIQSVAAFLREHSPCLNAVDLGCGDFAVGSQLRPYCGAYVACDVVEDVVERNALRYRNSDVTFRVVDITQDELPSADVVFLRQVLQHLSNSDIHRVIPKLLGYRYLVLTEHLPVSTDFEPNLDKKRGMDIRLHLGTKGSGIVLTAPPFDLHVKSAKILCEVEEPAGGIPGIIRTTLYEL
jgi:hypothetical protein